MARSNPPNSSTKPICLAWTPVQTRPPAKDNNVIIEICKNSDLKRSTVTDKEKHRMILEDDLRVKDLNDEELLFCIKHKRDNLFRVFLSRKKLSVIGSEIIFQCIQNNRLDYLGVIAEFNKFKLEDLIKYYSLGRFDEEAKIFSFFNPGYIGLPDFEDWRRQSNIFCNERNSQGLSRLISEGKLVTEQANNFMRLHALKGNNYLRAFKACKENDLMYLKDILN